MAAFGHIEDVLGDIDARAWSGVATNGVIFYTVRYGGPAGDLSLNPGEKSAGLLAAGTVSGTLRQIE